MSLASSATPITAPRDVGPTIRPLRLIESVITGAGSPVDVPLLIAVVSAMFCATLPGGTLCFALAASSSKSEFKSGSRLFVLRSSSNCSILFNLLSIAASVSISSNASFLRIASSTPVTPPSESSIANFSLISISCTSLLRLSSPKESSSSISCIRISFSLSLPISIIDCL